MNKETLSTIGVVALGAALLVVTRPSPVNSALPQAAAPAPTRTIHTNGSAVVKVKPDKVTLRLGVETFAPTPRQAQSDNAKIVEAVLKAVRGRGIAAQDIATDYFAVRPEYDYNVRPQRVLGYWTDNTVAVTLRQVDKLSEVLTASLDAGATSVDDVVFSTSRLRELRDQARAMAVKSAVEKARGMAGAAGLALGDVQSITDNSQWFYYSWAWNRRMSAAANLANMTQNVAQASPGQMEAPPEDGEFSLGQIVVQAQVDLTAAMK